MERSVKRCSDKRGSTVFGHIRLRLLASPYAVQLGVFIFLKDITLRLQDLPYIF